MVLLVSIVLLALTIRFGNGKHLNSNGGLLYPTEISYKSIDLTLVEQYDDSKFEEIGVHSYQFFTRFLARTTLTPLGPNLNPYSSVGVTNQPYPLVGLNMVQVAGVTGYWPLFTSLVGSAQVSNNSADQYWVNAYSAQGAEDVSCNTGDVIVGVRFLSHTTANLGGDAMSSVPDIQCSKLVLATTNVYTGPGVVNTRNTTDNGDGTTTIHTVDSVVNVQQCMSNTTKTFPVGQQSQTLNTCAGNWNPSGSSSPPTSLFLKTITSRTAPEATTPGGPEMIDLLFKSGAELKKSFAMVGAMSRDNSTDSSNSIDWLFGSGASSSSGFDTVNQNIASTSAANQAAAQAAYQSTWGTTAPTEAQIEQQLGAQPWNSADLLVNSNEFMAGSLMGGSKLVLVTGFTKGSVGTGPTDITQVNNATANATSGASGPVLSGVNFVCSQVFACEHGTCGDAGCSCNAGYNGTVCDNKLDPCGSLPCGSQGTCTEDFTKPSGYTCACNAGFNGTNCDQSSNACTYKPPVGTVATNLVGAWSTRDCGHGTCTPTPGVGAGYQCVCSPGFTNNNNNISDVCNSTSVNCVGSWSVGSCPASCQLTQTFSVVTPAAGTGQACQNNAGDTQTVGCNGDACVGCGSKDCNGRGQCSATTGNCQCNTGYTGPNCELQTDSCSTSTCNGHGNCVSGSAAGSGGSTGVSGGSTGVSGASFAGVSRGKTLPSDAASFLLDSSSSSPTCDCMNGWTSEGLGGGPNSDGKYCTLDPCDGCPTGMCNPSTGYCNCAGVNITSLPPGGPCGRLPGATPCVGTWSEWGVCGTDCTQKRYYSILELATGGGRNCPNKPGDVQSQACSLGGCCTLQASSCQNGALFVAQLCQCQCTQGWSGQYCQTSSSIADRVLQQTVTVNTSMLPDTAPPGYANQTALSDASTSTASGSSNFLIYAGAGLGLLLIIGGGYYYYTTTQKSATPTDPLAAALMGEPGMEGLDLAGMDLAGLDLSALDAGALSPTAPTK